MIKPIYFLLACIATAALADDATPQHAYLQMEAGPAFQSRNDFRIPSGSGTRVSLTDFSSGPFLAYRLYGGYRFGDHLQHEVRALWAPLSVQFSGTLSAPTDFQNQTFAPSVGTEARYQFHSYRLMYRYRFFESDTVRLFVGVTAKIRDAKIALSQGALQAERKDVGFVPLAHFRGEWLWGENWRGVLDIDGLIAPQGRAEDILLAVEWTPWTGWTFLSGYRTVEGGANNQNVFTFAWLHYLTFGLRYGW